MPHCVLTLVERVSGYVVIKKLSARNKEQAAAALSQAIPLNGAWHQREHEWADPPVPAKRHVHATYHPATATVKACAVPALARR